MTATIGNQRIITARIPLPYLGPWHATVESSGEVALSGAQVIDIDGIRFSCTVVRSTVDGGRVKTRLAGGAGGLSKELDAKHYSAPDALMVMRDILAETGEELDPTHELADLRMPAWQRSKGPASHAIGRLAEKAGMIWRVTTEGKIWVGKEIYPEQETEHRLIDEAWDAGLLEIAPELPDLLPGVTFRGQQIRYVVHILSESTLRTEAHLEPPGGLLNRFLAGIRRDIDYSRMYPGRVVAQNPDGTLQIVLDDPKVKGNGQDRVPIRTGLPGFEVKVSEGAKVSVGFDAGDPSRPYAALWDGTGSVQSVEFKPSGLGAPVCRVGDSFQLMIPTGVTITGLLSGVPFAGILIVTQPCTAIGQTGNGNLLA